VGPDPRGSASIYSAGFISGSALGINADPGSDPCGHPAKKTDEKKKIVLRICIGFSADTDPAFFVKADQDPDLDPGV
jgi:hypothetical protein